MSFQTWLAEAYPVPAYELQHATKVEATEHSLRKWKHMTPKILEKHGLCVDHSGDLYELKSVDWSRESFRINTQTCALCIKYYFDDPDTCGGCPLYDHLGQRCDRSSNDLTSPYHVWLDDHDPKPMIAALKAALKLAKQEE